MTADGPDLLTTIKAQLADSARNWDLCEYDLEWLIAEIDRLRGTPPTGGHTMRVTLTYDIISLTPVCHEPEGVTCRMMCPEGCKYINTTSEHAHGIESVDYCNAVKYLKGDGWTEKLCSNKGKFALYDGMPIEVECNGDGYTWAPVNPSVAVTT